MVIDPAQFAEKLAKELDLSQPQREQIQRLTETFKSENAETLSRAEKVRQEVLVSSQDGSRPTPEEIKAIADKHGNPGQDLMPAMKKLRDDVLAVLTPEQRQQLDQLRQQLKERRDEGRRGRSRRG
jgi:Spy/CpxP family protein refolding chaperone